MWISKVTENYRPDIAITLVFVALPLLLLGGVFGEFRVALAVALPGLLTEAWAVAVRLRHHFG
jgi:hypothetical protein